MLKIKKLLFILKILLVLSSFIYADNLLHTSEVTSVQMLISKDYDKVVDKHYCVSSGLITEFIISCKRAVFQDHMLQNSLNYADFKLQINGVDVTGSNINITYPVDQNSGFFKATITGNQNFNAGDIISIVNEHWNSGGNNKGLFKIEIHVVHF